MKKKIVILAICAVVVFVPAVGGILSSRAASGTSVGLANPFVKCETLDEAEQTAGFKITAPDKMAGCDGQTIRAIKGDLIEIIYSKGEDEQIRIRKAATNGDISGDYNQYKEVKDMTVNHISVVTKGDGDTIKLANWTNNGYSYSVYVSSGINGADMQKLIESIN